MDSDRVERKIGLPSFHGTNVSDWKRCDECRALIDAPSTDKPHPRLHRYGSWKVFADFNSPPVAASAVFPGRRLMAAHARAFVEALVAKFAGQECQALQQKTKQIKARSREKQPLKSPRQVSPV